MSVSIHYSLTREQPLTEVERTAVSAAMAEFDVSKYCTDDADYVPARTGLFGRRKPRAPQTSGVDCSASRVSCSPNLSQKRERPMRTVSATLPPCHPGRRRRDPRRRLLLGQRLNTAEGHCAVAACHQARQGAREGAAPISTGAITPVMGAVTNDVLDGLKVSGIDFNTDGKDPYRD